jgi:hypothetical protein
MIYDFEKYLKDLVKNKFYTLDIPYGYHIKNISVNKLPTEQSITNFKEEFTYNFDEYGYRYHKSKYDLNNNNKIFCFGCSFTMGDGIKFEDTWPFLLGKFFNDNYYIYNYGVSGTSNNSIYRRIYQFIKYLECNNLEYPKYIFVYFTEFKRDEILSIKNKNINIKHIGPWEKDHETYLKSKLHIHFLFEFIKNFKMIDEMCLSRNIKWYWSTWDPYFKFFSKEILQTYLNLNTILDSNYVKVIKKLDLARDNSHRGIETNKITAKDFYELTQQAY